MSRRVIELPDDFPTIVTLCGSTRFQDAYEKATREETLKGNIIISVGLFGHQEGLDMGGEVKAKLDELHLRKIDLADCVLVVSDGAGYIGISTRGEVDYAIRTGKYVRWQHHTAEVNYHALAEREKTQCRDTTENAGSSSGVDSAQC